MKVRCVKIIDPYTGKNKGLSDGDISVDNIYNVLVLSLNTKNYEDSYVRIESDDDSMPILFSLGNFEFVDPSILSNFGFYYYPDKKVIKIAPRSWQEYQSRRENWCDFWEDFYDNERAAVELYRREVAFIKGETYEPLPKEKPSAQELLEIYRRKERDHLMPDQGFNESFAPIALKSTDDWGQKKAL